MIKKLDLRSEGITPSGVKYMVHTRLMTQLVHGSGLYHQPGAIVHYYATNAWPIEQVTPAIEIEYPDAARTFRPAKNRYNTAFKWHWKMVKELGEMDHKTRRVR